MNLRERRRAQTKADVIRTGLDIISSEGVDATSIDRLAADAGMSRGTIYAHFEGGREEILREAYKSMGRELVRTAQDLARTSSSWDERIIAYAKAMVQLAQDPHRGYFYNVAGPALLGADGRRGEGSSASLEAIQNELLVAQSRGEVDPLLHARHTAVLLIGSLREAGVEIAREGMEPAEFLASFSRLLRGLQ